MPCTQTKSFLAAAAAVFFFGFLIFFYFCDVLFASHICLYLVVYQAGFIRHTVNKITFSEQCYYVFGDLCGSKS